MVAAADANGRTSARRSHPKPLDPEQTAELPVLRFGLAAGVDSTGDSANLLAPTSHKDVQGVRIAQLERELTELRARLSERDALIRVLQARDSDHAAEAEATAIHAPSSMNLSAPTRLLVRTAGSNGITHVLSRRNTIGRTPDNDIQVDHPSVSRHHAVVLSVGDDTYIEDLLSVNGVCVNGTPVMRHALSEGDIIDVGESRFRFLLKPP
jgi:hypothetical protein